MASVRKRNKKARFPVSGFRSHFYSLSLPTTYIPATWMTEKAAGSGPREGGMLDRVGDVEYSIRTK